MIYQGSKRYPVTELVFHCAATPKTWFAGMRTSQKVAEIRRWHVQDNRWKDIGYHNVIDYDGTIAQGRKYEVIGAGVLGHNSGVIHACLIGGKDSKSTDMFNRHYTRAQNSSMLSLIRALNRLTPIKIIKGHNDYDKGKACPGFSVAEWLRDNGGLAKILAS